jgi:hypothetical protein
MPIRLGLVALCSALLLAVGCDGRQPLSSSPSVSGQGQPTSAETASRFASAGDKGKTVSLMDACDPDTFNAAPPIGIGPGTCSRRGGVTFANFIDELTRHHSVGAWHMAPGEVMLQLGGVLSAINRGGENHTFTEVEEYGGGFVQVLNDLGGFGPTIPECNPGTVQMLHPGESFHETTDEVGVEKYQCCIHPWMRTEVRIVQH